VEGIEPVSIEVTLYPPHAKRNELVKFLKARGYEPSGHLWDWPAGTVNLYWFKSQDFTSFDGVEASVYPSSEEERAKWGTSEWAMHTRTRAGASPGDRQEQNETIRAGRKKFGGDFYNDWHGKNRYTPPDSGNRTPPARGLYIVYESTKNTLEAVKFALPDPIQGFKNSEGTKLEPLAQFDPTRMLYNGLVPFAVAALEHFFSQAFRILLRYDQRARQRLISQNARKVDFVDAVALSGGEKSIEDIVADWYSFQSIDSIHKAFQDWFAIDFWKLLRQRRKIGKRIDWLEKRLKSLIEFRHGIVHRFEFNPMLKKEGIEEILGLSLLLIEVFVQYIELSRGERIR
jgi:hypothetical protein